MYNFILAYADYSWFKDNSSDRRGRSGKLFQCFESYNEIGIICYILTPFRFQEAISAKHKKVLEKLPYPIVKKLSPCHYIFRIKKNVYCLSSIGSTNLFLGPLINFINNFLLVRAIHFLGFKNNDSFIINNPAYAKTLACAFPGFFKVFDTIDNWLLIDNYQNTASNYIKYIKSGYEYIDRNYNLIFAVSENLKTLFSNSQRFIFLGNGVDWGVFNPELAPEVNFLKKDNSTVVGYVGNGFKSLNYRCDASIIVEILEEIKEVELVIVGEIGEDVKKFLNKFSDRIFYSGVVSPKLVPGYIKLFQIAIIPHRVNDATNTMNPLKLYEYLAMGRHIVTTPVYGTAEFKDLIRVTYTKNEFRKAISELKDSPLTKELIAKRRDAVKRLDWSNIAKRMFDEVVKTISSER